MDKVTAIVLLAGRGRRMKSEVPKQFMKAAGREVAAWSLQAFQDFEEITDIVAVTGAEDIDYLKETIIDPYGISKARRIVSGGAERYLSVWEGLKAAEGSDYVFIHDGARPVVSREILARCMEAVRTYGACVAAMPVKDTIKIADADGFVASTPDRRFVWQIQTPQVFRYELIYEAHRKLIEEGRSDVTDDASVLEAESDVKVKLVEGAYENIKITTPEDIETAQRFLISK